MLPLLRGLAAAAALALAATLPATAQPVSLPALSGPVILTVTGLDAAIVPDGQVAFDLGRLEALGLHSLDTSSIWTEGVHHYEGVLLHSVIEALGLSEVTLRLHALNDYKVDLPADEVTAEAPLLAFRVDGALLSVRDKGPIWLIYPFDSHARYRTDTIFARSVWQIERIEVLR